MKDTINIHGTEWDHGLVLESIAECQALTWDHAQWTKPDDMIDRPGAHSHCMICWWQMLKCDDPEKSTGYTDGKGNWVCLECHRRFFEEGAQQKGAR